MRTLVVVFITAMLLLIASPLVSTTSVRLSGADRYQTAVEISQYQYPEAADKVYLANGETLVDAMAVESRHGPVILVQRDYISKASLDEIARLRPHTIVVLGGTSVISNDVKRAAERAAAGKTYEQALLDLQIGSGGLPYSPQKM